LTTDDDDENMITDGVWCYCINILKSLLLLADIKDAVASGNGELREQLLVYFYNSTFAGKFFTTWSIFY
jgi:hypothetical protein